MKHICFNLWRYESKDMNFFQCCHFKSGQDSGAHKYTCICEIPHSTVCFFCLFNIYMYLQTSNISHTSGNKIIDHSDIHVVGASPVWAAPTTSSFWTWQDRAKTTARRDERHLRYWIWCALYYRFDSILLLWKGGFLFYFDKLTYFMYNQWLGVKLQYLQYVSNRDTAVLH